MWPAITATAQSGVARTGGATSHALPPPAAAGESERGEDGRQGDSAHGSGTSGLVELSVDGAGGLRGQSRDALELLLRRRGGALGGAEVGEQRAAPGGADVGERVEDR